MHRIFVNGESYQPADCLAARQNHYATVRILSHHRPSPPSPYVVSFCHPCCIERDTRQHHKARGQLERHTKIIALIQGQRAVAPPQQHPLHPGIVIAYTAYYISERDQPCSANHRRRESHDMHEMQGPDDCGPFAGYEGKLSPDVDAGFSVPDLRQYHGPIDPFSPFDPAGPASRATHETFGEKDGSTGRGGIGSRRCRKTKQSTRRGLLSHMSVFWMKQENTTP